MEDSKEDTEEVGKGYPRGSGKVDMKEDITYQKCKGADPVEQSIVYNCCCIGCNHYVPGHTELTGKIKINMKADIFDGKMAADVTCDNIAIINKPRVHGIIRGITA